MEENKKYIIRFEINDKELVFTAKIISIDDNFITFTDKFGKTLTYNKKNMVSAEEVSK